jgi:hypothetical protein
MSKAGLLYKNFKTDESVEKTGIVLEYGMASNGKETWIRIARAGGANTRFAKLMEQKTAPYRRQIQTKTLDESIAQRITKEVYAEAVVIGWGNVEDEDGNLLDFTTENVIKVFTDLPDLYADLIAQSQEIALFRAEVREADSKN